jgi:dTDP-4-dehydrorhamnose reductase/SAM-dependent methyltransferase
MPGKILVTGGEGALAQAIAALEPGLLAPGRGQMDVSRYGEIAAWCDGREIEVVIHAGAVTNRFAEDRDEDYIATNIIGTANVALWCRRNGVRLVYISSDYVYPGETGGYSEHAPLYPVNRYAASKLGGEIAVGLVPGSLIIRTSFYTRLDFPRACTDQFTSRMPIREAAEAVLRLARMPGVTGVINVGRRRKRSLHEIVRDEFNPAAEPVLRKDIRIPYGIPRDTSMNTDRFETIMHTSDLDSHARTTCRICRAATLHTYLDLGRTPLANSYLRVEELNAPEFSEELAIQVCTTCGLSQLTQVVHPDRMFRNYLYVSSTTQTFRDHCVEMAGSLTRRAGLATGDLVMDIASNDGCLLSRFQDLGMSVVGVDPAENLAAEANAAGIRTLCAYWSPAMARDIAARIGRPKVITATNVFAHVDDLHDFVAGVDLCLAPRGVFAIECPYVLDFIEKNEFDTAYHEHLSYIGITPLITLMGQYGLEVFDVEYFAHLHGGTVRVCIARRGDYEVRPAVPEYTAREAAFGITTPAPYAAFAGRVLRNREELLALLRREAAAGKTIWAYGASAKGNTLLNFFGITSDLVPVAIDDNPKKWNYYTPGSRLRITGIEELRTSRVDALLLLAWNFQTEIMRRCAAVDYRGAYILPVPVPTIVPS